MSSYLTLEMAVDDAIKRIKKGYEMTDGKIYLSFSGGKDSTVVAHLIKMSKLPINIPFVFANTRIELDATVEFVKNFDYDNVVIVYPRKPFGQILKEYGKPAMSKQKSQIMNTYQNNLGDPLIENYPKVPTSKLGAVRACISGQSETGGVPRGFRTHSALAKKHYHMLHPDRINEYKIANKCCEFMKKKPFNDFVKEHGMKGGFNGMRPLQEGGVRKISYGDKGCTHIKANGFVSVMPIFDWTDELMTEFIETYNIELSKAYELYGYKRTGCIGCPFAQDIEGNLQKLFEHEPKKYKATIGFLKDVYADQGVNLPFDPVYMEYKKERDIINEKRRQEMLDKFAHMRDWTPTTKEEYLEFEQSRNL
jgi:3'-phosphoadenosine 5'-phosphosulfate sulfotransferase (PAPS reductase)/FAD synthetase